LTTANRPTVGRLPQNFEFELSFAPRPCGEMTSGSGGFASGREPAGRRTVASRRSPVCAVQVIV
jgi:hypothetical protein